MPGRFGLVGCAGLVGLGLVLASPEPARSELMAVTQVAIGMECPECARKLRLDAKKLDGVDEVSTSWNRRILTLRLRPGNKCTLTAIRLLLRQHHFVPGEAEITVSGQLARDQNGLISFQVSGSNVVLRLDVQPNLASLFDGISPGTEIVLRGRIAAETASADGRTTALLPLWVLDVEGLTAQAHSRTSRGTAKPSAPRHP